MQSQRSPRSTRGPGTDGPRNRPSLHVAAHPRSAPLFRTLGVVTAALVATGGYVHYCLYRHGYRTIPKIGVGFLLQVAASAIVATALLVGPHRIGRMTHVSEQLAGTTTGLAAAGLSAATLVAFALTRTPGGLFNFQERGLQPAPQALIALTAEAGVLVVLAGWGIAGHAAGRNAPVVPAPAA